MKIIGVDLHTRQQTIAMLDDQTGELAPDSRFAPRQALSENMGAQEKTLRRGSRRHRGR